MLPLSASFVVRLGSLLGVLSASVAVRASQQIVFALYFLFCYLDADKLFSKLKCHELSSKSLTMILLILLSLLLLVLVLMTMMLTPPTSLSHLL
jgi:hypothetical protein